jgi:hypothetical protein
VGTSIRGKFTDDTNDRVIESYITVRPDVVAALAAMARRRKHGVRASARGIGVLQAREAVPDLIAALRTKDTDVLYESLIHDQKIG